MNINQPIFLIGFMGSGKSTLARELGLSLQLDVIDTDQRIEKQANRSISEIFNRYGEFYFRVKERLHFHSVQNKAMLIATGGGYPFYLNDIMALRNSGLVIFVDTPWEECWRRMSQEEAEKRPLAIDEKLFHELYQRRKDVYLQADIVFHPLQSTITSLVIEIERYFSEN